MFKCVDYLCDKSLEAVSRWFTSGTHNELHLFTIHQDFGFIKDIAKESAAVWYNQLHFNTITICYNVTIWELHEDFCRPPYVTICCISILQIVTKMHHIARRFVPVAFVKTPRQWQSSKQYDETKCTVCPKNRKTRTENGHKMHQMGTKFKYKRRRDQAPYEWNPLAVWDFHDQELC